MKLARVFPSKTKLTPEDPDAYLGVPPLFATDYDAVHISCTFTWDKPYAEQLKHEWEAVCQNVQVGGPAYGSPAGEFTPGLYLKEGGVITSRGCPNRCTHCLVPEREGPLRQQSIHPGFNVLDNNLLACSRSHMAAVFRMLNGQKQQALFTGGLEAARMTDWAVGWLRGIRLGRLFLAFDQDGQEKTLARALRKLTPHFDRRKLKCYVLVGFPGDTLQAAEARCVKVWEMGALPFAMFYRDSENRNKKTPEWREFQVIWTRPPASFHRAAMLGLPGGIRSKETDQLEFLHVKNREVPRRFQNVIEQLDGGTP